MHFIRENLFLVCVVAAVVVIGGVMIFMEFSLAGDVDTQLAQRKEVADRIRSLANQARSKPINQMVVEAEKERVEVIKAAAQKVMAENARWNRDRYKVMTYELTEGNKKIQVPLFPINEDLFRLRALRFHFQQVYHSKLEAMLGPDKLDAIQPPTDQEIKEQIAHWESEIKAARESRQALRAREMREGVPAPGVGPGAMPGMERGMAPPPMMGPTPTIPGAGRRGTGVEAVPAGMPAPVALPKDVDPEAYELFGAEFQMEPIPAGISGGTSRLATYLGYMSARKNKASMKGKIYASREVFDAVFPWNMASASPADTYLWWAQVNLWVTQDIVDAIVQTNKLAAQEVSKPSVLTLPIKRLVRIDVAEKSGDAVTATVGQRTGDRRGLEGGMMTPPPMTLMPEMGGPGAPGMPAKPTGPTEADTLTKRVAHKDYDLFRYQFTVVMRAEYLKVLQTALMSMNYHTITDVSMTEVSPANDTHYYGVEPVMEITIKGELIMLTSWLRGTFDKTKNAFAADCPPLMPLEVLDTLPVNALREEDTRRLTEAKKNLPAAAAPPPRT